MDLSSFDSIGLTVSFLLVFSFISGYAFGEKVGKGNGIVCGLLFTTSFFFIFVFPIVWVFSKIFVKAF